jgi:hypothetical protein
VLTNAGTVNWTGTGTLLVWNDNGVTYNGGIYNLSGALFNIQNDQSMQGEYPYAFFNNAGTVRKSGTAGTTGLALAFNNTGTLDVQSGTVSLNNGGALGGNATVAAGAQLSFGGGNFLVNGFSATGAPGTQFSFSGGTFSGGAVNLIGTGLVVQDSGGNAPVSVSAPLANLTVSGASLSFNGTVTNLTLSGGSLVGTNTILGTMNWTGGAINSGAALTIATGAVLNLGGTASLDLYGVLTNAGTVNWTGTGTLLVWNDNGVTYNGGIYNLSGALFSIQNDQSMQGEYAYAFFNNAGTVRKSGTAGTTGLALAFNNTGMLDVQSGTVSLNGSYDLTGGILNAGVSNLATYGQIHLAGSAALTSTLGLQFENGFSPLSGNSFAVLTYGSETGGFTNFNLPPRMAWGTNYGSTVLTLTVLNLQPNLAPVANGAVNELSLFTTTAIATDADVGRTLTYGLVSAPFGMSINPSSGVITWTPAQTQSPSTNTVTVIVTNDGTPPLSDTTSFTVVVREVNVAPVLLGIGAQTVNEPLALR